ncbi:hypothetical protein [Bifidobacterium sp. SO1]|uniref:hypothetical protein n=1 Tax=Bifidobacterium sp. SO1 TaxID=2809029 RepID=UPI001BDD1269|nr:hypothetical protein [Bifidobacterium sp. SO1]MBT1161843.1 hypothetical protein [Bifidobacterium sp. SO1]
MKATITYEWTEYGTIPLPRLRKPRNWIATRTETIELREHDPINPAIGDYIWDGSQWWSPIGERDLPRRPDWDREDHDRSVRNHTRYEETAPWMTAADGPKEIALRRSRARMAALMSFHETCALFDGQPYRACGEPHWRLGTEYRAGCELWRVTVCEGIHEHTDECEWNITRIDDAMGRLDEIAGHNHSVDRTIPDMPVHDVRTVNTVFHDYAPIPPEHHYYSINDGDMLLDVYADWLNRLKTIPNILHTHEGVTMLDRRLLSVDQEEELQRFRERLRSNGMLLA